jgi:carbamoyltransferase
MKHVVVSGGIFYNVKLNNSIVKKTDGLFSVVPIAGDQGCGIGMYEAFIGDFKFGDMKFGPRNTFADYEDKLTPEESTRYGKYIKYFSPQHRSEMLEYVAENLQGNKIVNIVFGKMEYGPRALCNTTTLALPYVENVDYINELNARDTVMPMAPVMPKSAAKVFYDTSVVKRIVGSDRYMILTYDYLEPDLDVFGGVCHKYPEKNTWSGRPQFVGDECPFMLDLFDRLDLQYPALINTSFNAHGRPIVHEWDSTFDSFSFEVERALALGKEPPILVLSDISS